MNTYTDEFGVEFSLDNKKLICAGNSYIKEYEIPSCVISIEERAFHNCIKLISIKIPDSVTSIGDSAFWRCGSLTSITIPDSLKSIWENNFSKHDIYYNW